MKRAATVLLALLMCAVCVGVVQAKGVGEMPLQRFKAFLNENSIYIMREGRVKPAVSIYGRWDSCTYSVDHSSGVFEGNCWFFSKDNVSLSVFDNIGVYRNVSLFKGHRLNDVYDFGRAVIVDKTLGVNGLNESVILLCNSPDGCFLSYGIINKQNASGDNYTVALMFRYYLSEEKSAAEWNAFFQAKKGAEFISNLKNEVSKMFTVHPY